MVNLKNEVRFMTRIRRIFKGQGIACLGVAVFAVCAVLVFFPAFPKFVGLASPDASPYYGFAYRTGVLEGLLTGGAFTPHTLYWLLFNPLYAHELTYVIDTLVLVLAGVYYLMGRRVHPLAAWTGGLALGMSGYTFTLFCAGHRGYFYMFSCAVWAFGLLIRCFETRKLFYFAMLGLVLAWGVPYQPDVLVLVGAVAAAYALWLTIRHRSQESEFRVFNAEAQRSKGLGKCEGIGKKGKGSPIWENVVSVWPRFSVSVLVLALAGFGGIRSAVTTQIAGRDAQIAGVSAQAFDANKKPAKLTDAEKHTRWLFATNWSLPPEDMLEFIVPGVFGNESMQMPYPYWGRLGRPSDEVFQKGRMMPNYRQHTVYLGIVSVLFALFAVVVYVSGRRTKNVSPLQPAADLRPPASDIPFWCAVWVVCLVLAMGRYLPLYRIFYAIPYMDYIRAPVKFHHLAELATAFLAGFGMDAFMRAPYGASALRRKLAWLAGGLTVALVLGAGLMLVNKPDIVKHISSLGLGQAAETLSGYAVQNLMRSACFAALVAGLAYASHKGGERAVARIGTVFLLVFALDQAWVAQRYVRVINVEPLYRENVVVKAINKAGNGQIVNVVNYATSPNASGIDWFGSSLTFNGIRSMSPSQEERGTPYERLFSGLQNAPVRLWNVLHAQGVIVPRKAAEGLLRAGVLRSVMDFELGAGVVRQALQPGEQNLTLASIPGALKGPVFVAGWQGDVPVEKQVDAVVGGRQTVSDAPSPAGGNVGGAGEVEVLAAHGLPGVFASRVRVSAKVPGLLIFDERTTDKQEILIDGKPVQKHVADVLWPAALVPVGEHEVVLRQQRKPASFLMSVLTTLAVLGWGLCAMLRGHRAQGAGVVA
jgi:hypothetical protein